MHGRLWIRKVVSMRGMAVVAEPRRVVGKGRKANIRSIKPGAGEGRELNPSSSSRFQTRAARCFARFAATRLTPSACTLTWCGFMAWPSAREARGPVKPIQTAVNRGSHGQEYAARSGLWLEPAGAQVVFEVAKIFGQFRGPAHAHAWLVWMFEGEVFCV